MKKFKKKKKLVAVHFVKLTNNALNIGKPNPSNKFLHLNKQDSQLIYNAANKLIKPLVSDHLRDSFSLYLVKYLTFSILFRPVMIHFY